MSFHLRAAPHIRRGVLSLVCLLFSLITGVSASEPPVLMVLGDSLSAGYGIPIEQGWVSRLQRRLDRDGHGYRVVNASISGDTTRGALTRLDQALQRHQPRIVVVELGGNDGLRGVALAETRRNLQGILDRVRTIGARPLLVGMRLPPNYGPDYTQGFHGVFTELAAGLGIPLVPFLLDGVALDPELMQDDGIHPRAAAQERVLANVWTHLAPLL